MLDELKTEIGHLVQSWWCRGHGIAVLLLLVTVLVFRDARDFIFWIAIAFFGYYTVASIQRYRTERSIRTKAIVTSQHTPQPIDCQCGKLLFDPRPVNCLITLKVPTNMK